MFIAALIFDNAANWEAVLRLILAALAGGLVGLEREIRGREAGFRTNMLVCLGSALVMVVSTGFAAYPWQASPGVNLNVDPARIAYGVMTGVGFLGAGTIIHNQGTVRGLTTAAGLWCVAAIGLSIGFGLYFLSAMAVLLVVVTLWVLDHIEDLVPKQRRRDMTIRVAYRPGCAAELAQRLTAAGMKVTDTSLRRSEDLTEADIHLQLVFYDPAQYKAVESSIENDPQLMLISAREF